MYIKHRQSFNKALLKDPKSKNCILQLLLCSFGKKIKHKKKISQNTYERLGIFSLLHKPSRSCQNSISLLFISRVHLNTRMLLYELFLIFLTCKEFFLLHLLAGSQNMWLVVHGVLVLLVPVLIL